MSFTLAHFLDLTITKSNQLFISIHTKRDFLMLKYTEPGKSRVIRFELSGSSYPIFELSATRQLDVLSTLELSAGG